jgi:hypothetical protein
MRSYRHSTAVFAAVAAALALGLVGARAARQQAAPVLADLAIGESATQDGFFNSVWDAYPVIPGGQKAFRSASPEQRAAIVRGLGGFLKTYAQSDAFRRRYAAAREANRPRPREAGKSLEEMDREQDAALAEMEANIKSMPAEMREQMAQTVKELKAQQAEFRKDKALRAMMQDSLTQQQIANEAAHKQDLAEYEANYPANPDALIARRLQTFLEISGTVDFGAKLVKRGSQLRFESPDYEARPPEWKLCYRAGQEATEAARAFAAEWLKTLPSGS